MHKKTRPDFRLTGLLENLRLTLQRVYVLCLGSFQAFTNGEFNLLAFFEGLTAVADDLAEMNENVTLAFTRNKTKTVLVSEMITNEQKTIPN